MAENRVDYVLTDGTRGVWEYEMIGDFAQYIDQLSFINKKLGGQLRELVLVEITEKDTDVMRPKKVPKAPSSDYVHGQVYVYDATTQTFDLQAPASTQEPRRA